jgi:hypothetical protein
LTRHPSFPNVVDRRPALEATSRDRGLGRTNRSEGSHCCGCWEMHCEGTDRWEKRRGQSWRVERETGWGRLDCDTAPVEAGAGLSTEESCLISMICRTAQKKYSFHGDSYKSVPNAAGPTAHAVSTRQVYVSRAFKQRGTVQRDADTWDTRMVSSSYLLSTHSGFNGAYDSAHVSPNGCSDRICRQFAPRRVLRGSTDRALEFAWLLAHCRPRCCVGLDLISGQQIRTPPAEWSLRTVSLLASRDSVWSTNH